jgi:hypothetical protein
MKNILKLLLIISFCSLLLCGCKKEEIKEKETTKKIQEKKEEMKDTTPKIEKTIDIGLYLKNNQDYELVETIERDFTLNKDIALLYTFFTKEKNIYNKTIKNAFKENRTNLETYKIGYNIKFTIKDRVFEKTVLKPYDTKEFYDYIQMYLYDDINIADGTFYSHLEEMKDNTIITSIKLTGSSFEKDITSDINLTSFIYLDNEITLGKYTGKNLHTTIIKRK